MAARRILITGISTYLGTELARRLEADHDVEYLAGIDTRKPGGGLERTDFIEADIRNPVIAKLLPQTGVDTVGHNQILRPPGRLSARAGHDINLIGPTPLLAACAPA